MSPPLRFLVLACLVLATACSTSPDKRVLQYLNTQGFGNRYTGNAEEQNYVTIGDTLSFFDRLNSPTGRGGLPGAGLPGLPSTTPGVPGGGLLGSGGLLGLGQAGGIPGPSGTFVVDIDGTIVVPEVGAVVVAGLTREEIEALLNQKYSAYYPKTDIQVTIRTSAKRFFIFGEVLAEGARPFPGDLTVFEAVMTARPMPHTANLGRIKVIRADPRDPLIITVNLGELFRHGDSTYNILVQERDIILVPPTFLAQLGYFVNDLISPFTTVLANIFRAILPLARFNRFNNFGGGGGGGLGFGLF